LSRTAQHLVLGGLHAMLLCINMPIREEPLVTDKYYHLFNRGVAKATIFIDGADYDRALKIINYYHFNKPPIPYSQLIKKSFKTQKKIIDLLSEEDDKLVDIICYCLMPNHFHLLLKQLVDDGISNFLRKFQNSYAKYLNKRYERVGSVFQNPFKSVLVKYDNQLLHLSRYIHLNPYTSALIKQKKNLVDYIWSSLPQYFGKNDGFCQMAIVLDQFKSNKGYEKFVFDQADYQRELESIEDLAHD